MSKKIIIIGAVIIAIFAALPFVGNMGVKTIIDERMTMLDENGIKVESSDNGSSYLETKSHYEFTLEDPVAFQNYLATLSKAQVPAYLHAMLDDVVMAADVSYSNLVVNSDVSLDLYPVAFTKEAGDRMKTEDATLYEQMIKMLENREFMYHMDYDVSASTFKGYIKDINKEISFQDGKKATIVFEAATFNGKGTLVEPESVDLQIKNADVDFSLPEDAKMKLSMTDLQSSSSFSAKNSFDLNYKAKTLHFFFKDQLTQLQIDASDMKTVSDSKVVNAQLETKVNASMKHFKMQDQNGSLELEDFAFVMDADNIDEKSYEAFQKASEQAGASSQHSMLAALGVVSKGFNLHIEKLSVKKIAIKESGMMDGFDHKINITVKEDDTLVQKMQMRPMALMQNINIDAKLKFASAFYSYMKTQSGKLSLADTFVKQEGDNAVFDILLQDGKITVNGQSL
ncbi:MAG: hypothetical protein WBF77_11000 [Sulfurimonadaceae bacterium]